MEYLSLKENKMEKTKTSGVWLKSLAVWWVFIPCAVLNGGLREKVLPLLMGQEAALPVSGVLLCVLILAVTWLLLPWVGKQRRSTFLRIGGVWCILTVSFEILLGLSGGSSIREIGAAYDVTTGNLWLAVVVCTGMAPYWVASMRKLFVR